MAVRLKRFAATVSREVTRSFGSSRGYGAASAAKLLVQAMTARAEIESGRVTLDAKLWVR
jgi:hypothetical protein